jgi:hypothetical protein
MIRHNVIRLLQWILCQPPSIQQYLPLYIMPRNEGINQRQHKKLQPVKQVRLLQVILSQLHTFEIIEQ